MRQNKVLKLFLVAVAFTVMLVTAGILAFNLSARQAIPKKEKSSVPNSSLNQPVQSPNSTVPNPLSPVVSPDMQPEEAEWETYRDEKYKFEIQYPKKGWNLMTKNGSPALPYTPVREPTNLYTQRAVPTQGPISAPITVSVYETLSTPIIQWLSTGYGVDLSNVQRGDLETTLVRAYGGETGILSYNEIRKDEISVYEVGGAWANGYALTYAVFIKGNSPYVYEINFELPYYGSKFNAKPSDDEYIKVFKKVISSFHFTD